MNLQTTERTTVPTITQTEYRPVEDFEGLAASFVGGLAQQIEATNEVTPPKITEATCAKYWTGYFNPAGQWTARPIRCGKCDDCLQRKAERITRRVNSRVLNRKEDNDSLILSVALNVPEGQIMALQKRLQRDETAQYVRAYNGEGYDYFIQSETSYGDEIAEIEYDFALAAKVAKSTGKRITGQLHSTKSKRIKDDSETYRLGLTKITARRPADSKTITTLGKAIIPTAYAHTPQDHQARLYAMTTELTQQLDNLGIAYYSEALFVNATEKDRLKYNANVICPNKAPIKNPILISALNGQTSLFDEVEADEPIFYSGLETTIAEEIERQLLYCWQN